LAHQTQTTSTDATALDGKKQSTSLRLPDGTRKSNASTIDTFLDLSDPDEIINFDVDDGSDDSSRDSMSSSSDRVSMAVSMASTSVGRNALNALLSRVGSGSKGGNGGVG